MTVSPDFLVVVYDGLLQGMFLLGAFIHHVR